MVRRDPTQPYQGTEFNSLSQVSSYREKSRTPLEVIVLGHLAKLIKVDLEWESVTQETPSSVVLKNPTNSTMDEIGGDFESNVDHQFPFDLHNTECDFYQLWDSEEPPLRIPRCYFHQKVGANQLGILVLENVAQNGTVADYLDVIDCMNLNRTLDLAKQMGHFASWTILNPGKWLGKFPHQKKDAIESWIPFLRSCLQVMKRNWPEEFPIISNEFLATYATKDEIWSIYSAPEDLGIAPILSHGDLWGLNFMLRTATNAESEKTTTDEIRSIFDWQMVHYGTPGEDLSRAIRSSVSTEIRRNSFEDVLSLYYETIKSDLASNNTPVQIPFTYAQLVDGYNYLALSGLVMGIASISMQTIVALESTDEEMKAERIPKLKSRLKDLLDDYLDAKKRKMKSLQ